MQTLEWRRHQRVSEQYVCAPGRLTCKQKYFQIRHVGTCPSTLAVLHMSAHSCHNLLCSSSSGQQSWDDLESTCCTSAAAAAAGKEMPGWTPLCPLLKRKGCPRCVYTSAQCQKEATCVAQFSQADLI